MKYKKPVMILAMSIVIGLPLGQVDEVLASENHIEDSEERSMEGETTDILTDLDMETFIDEVIERSPDLLSLENSVSSLQRQLADLKASTDSLEELYDVYPQYKKLYNLYERMDFEDTDYENYLSLAAKAANQTASEEELIVVATYESENPKQMTYEELLTYRTLKSTFESAGIDNPNMSESAEYETFYKTIHITPLELQKSLNEVKNKLNTATNTLTSNALNIYISALSLEKSIDLQQKSYALSLRGYDYGKLENEQGKLSDDDLEKQKNNLEQTSSQLSIASHQLDNLTMQMNLLLNQPVDSPLNLQDNGWEVPDLETEAYYEESALTNRSEIQNMTNAIATQTSLRNHMRSFFGEDDPHYMIEDTSLSVLDEEMTMAQESIEKEMKEAYQDVETKGAQVDLLRDKQSYQQSDYEQMALKESLGMATETQVRQSYLSLLESNMNLESAKKTYYQAYQALMDAASLGPAYDQL